jgi:hypothetical protein
VNNTPPVGLAAASATNASQIENPTSSATDNCDFNMQSYLVAGVPAGSTIYGVRSIVAHGEEIATGTKAGSVQILSNPAQGAESAFNYGNDAGAEGTYPTTWAVAADVEVSGSGVALGTQPVVRIGKRTATTRVVSVCFVGLYIDYYSPKSIPPYTGPFVRSPDFFKPRRRVI